MKVKVSVGRGLERFRRAHLGVGFVAGRIVAKLYPSVKAPGNLRTSAILSAVAAPSTMRRCFEPVRY